MRFLPALPPAAPGAFLYLAAWLALPGCASNDPAGASAGGSGSGGFNQGGTSTVVAGSGEAPRGSVIVSLAAPADGAEGYSTLIARFFDGPTPDAFQVALDTEQGDCQLLVPVLPFCSESCGAAVCTADEECTSYPAPLSVGMLIVDGLGSALMLPPASSMLVYQSPSLPYPPCDEGTTVSASANGFELAAECIAPLALTGPDPIAVSAGEAVQVAWAAAAVAKSSRVRIGLDISHHGGKKGQIDCDVADTGSFDIPEPLVTKLVGLGLAGYPTINVNRVSLGVDANNPNVSLVLSSAITRAVDTGVASCQDDVECPDGQTCQPVGICD